MKEIFEKKYGSDFTVIKPENISGFMMPCPVAGKNGWQVENMRMMKAKPVQI